MDFATHPIRDLYHAGIDVTINSDDALIFDSDVSKFAIFSFFTIIIIANQWGSNHLSEAGTK